MNCQTKKQYTVAIAEKEKNFQKTNKTLGEVDKNTAHSVGIYLTNYFVPQPAAPIFETRFFSHSDFL